MAVETRYVVISSERSDEKSFLAKKDFSQRSK